MYEQNLNNFKQLAGLASRHSLKFLTSKPDLRVQMDALKKLLHLSDEELYMLLRLYAGPLHEFSDLTHRLPPSLGVERSISILYKLAAKGFLVLDPDFDFSDDDFYDKPGIKDNYVTIEPALMVAVIYEDATIVPELVAASASIAPRLECLSRTYLAFLEDAKLGRLALVDQAYQQALLELAPHSTLFQYVGQLQGTRGLYAWAWTFIKYKEIKENKFPLLGLNRDARSYAPIFRYTVGPLNRLQSLRSEVDLRDFGFVAAFGDCYKIGEELLEELKGFFLDADKENDGSDLEDFGDLEDGLFDDDDEFPDLESIAKKKMFFNAEMEPGLRAVEAAIHHHASHWRKDGREQKGVNILFHGPSGTGKSQLALQLARAYGMSPVHLRITDLQSSFVGKTENNVKRLFQKIKQKQLDTGKVKMIIFDEADSFMEARKDYNTSYGHAINMLVNVLLLELEQFQGIFIATTNRLEVLDAAFHRRFHHSIAFSQPDAHTRARLLREYLGLNKVNASYFSEEVVFTAAELDVFIQKLKVNEFSLGRSLSFDEIMRLWFGENLISEKAVMNLAA